MFQARSAINTVRIRTAIDTAPGARSIVARQLSSVDLEPRELPPSAILLIRGIRDPMPGRLAVTANAPLLDQRWQQEVRGAVAAFARAATRPVHGRIAGDPEAVFFTDDAELLACMLLDSTVSGQPVPWWRHAIAQQVPELALFPLRGLKIGLLPAVFRQLARWDAAERIALALDSGQALQLAQQLAEHLELTELARVLSNANARAGPSTTGEHRVEPDDQWEIATQDDMDVGLGADEQVSESSAATRQPAPHINPVRWFTAKDPRLTTEHQILIGIALGAACALGEMSSSTFASRLTHWMQWSRSLIGPSDVGEGGREPHSRVDLPERVERDDRHFDPEGQQPTRFKSLDAKPTSQDSLGSARADSPKSSVDHGKRESAAAADTSVSAEPTSDTPIWSVEGVTTDLGGVLYLVNLLEALQLPDCFEPEARLASAVGAFGVLEGIARVLIPDATFRLRRDSIWEVLATLDRRAPGAPPRGETMIRGAWRLPHAWFVNFAEGQARDRCANVATPPGGIAALAALRGLDWPETLLAWLEFVLPFLEWRLREAFGTPSDVASGALLKVPARLYVSESHIDVVISLENVRLPLRMAGLDRSPGWVKSMQRVVLFHFQ